MKAICKGCGKTARRTPSSIKDINNWYCLTCHRENLKNRKYNNMSCSGPKDMTALRKIKWLAKLKAEGYKE